MAEGGKPARRLRISSTRAADTAASSTAGGGGVETGRSSSCGADVGLETGGVSSTIGAAQGY